MKVDQNMTYVGFVESDMLAIRLIRYLNVLFYI